MKLDMKSRSTIDCILLPGIVGLSFLPAVGTEQGHFAMAAGTLRIISVVLFATVLMSTRFRSKAPILSPKSRLGLDLTAAAMLIAMSWWETFPAGNHLTETAIYLALGLMLATLALLTDRAPSRVAAA